MKTNEKAHPNDEKAQQLIQRMKHANQASKEQNDTIRQTAEQTVQQLHDEITNTSNENTMDLTSTAGLIEVLYESCSRLTELQQMLENKLSTEIQQFCSDLKGEVDARAQQNRQRFSMIEQYLQQSY